MSEEFTKIATQEILEDISYVAEILDSCRNDADVFDNANNFQKPFHKIKGLAPMMGKEHVGKLADTFDSLMKHMLHGKNIPGIYDALTESVLPMKKYMTESDTPLRKIHDQITSKLVKNN